METVNLTQVNQAPPPRSKWKSFLESFPIIQFVLAGAIGLVAAYTTLQLSQNIQASEIRRNSERIERLEKESVTREIFDERTKTILDRLDKQDSKLDRLLEK
jgi:Flp pilus assembly protein TadB